MLLDMNKNEAVVQNLIFTRLAPLLVLKVIPYTHFGVFYEKDPIAKDSLATLVELLIVRSVMLHVNIWSYFVYRMTQVYEFEEVRRVSAQDLSYLPGVVWAVSSFTQIQSALAEEDHYRAKMFIFTWFNGIKQKENTYSYSFQAYLFKGAY